MKDLEIYKKHLTPGRVIIKTAIQYTEALERAKEIKNKLSELAERKAEMTKPLNEALKSIHDLFRPLETQGKEALDALRNGMMAYTKTEETKADKKKQKLLDAIEKGEIDIGKAVATLEAMPMQQKTVSTEDARATTVKVKAYRVIDKSKIPLEYLEPNMVAIKAAFRAGVIVPGVEQYYESSLRIG